MRVSRRNNELNDAIEVIDQKFIEAQNRAKTAIEAVPLAWSMLDADELEFVDQELGRCVSDRRYYLENYHVIRDESGNMRTVYPALDQQEILYEALESDWAKRGCSWLIVLKPRQATGTTWSAGVVFHYTVFTPNTFSLAMAQDPEVSGEIYQRLTDAYHNLPFWLKPEYLSKQQGQHIIFQRTDESARMTDPGLGSTLIVSHAAKASGIAIGRTVKALHGSEVSRWPSSAAWTTDIKPSMNAPDTLAIMESTAFGRSGLFWNLWRAAEQGKSVWKPVFIPVYKVRKYSLPVYKSEGFKFTPEERALRVAIKAKEEFTVPLGFFKWRRREIQETINSTGSEDDFYESYPMTPGEAFVSSGFCAFPRKELTRQQREHCRDPLFIGEIEYVSAEEPPVLHMHPPNEGELINKPETINRFWLWERPRDGEEYYAASDVSSGESKDFSDCVVYRLGWGSSPDVQVAEWHGLINASHYAKVCAAIGYLYNTAELAVEYTGPGITTGDELRWALDYPNLYRWKHMDKVSGVSSQHIHWVTNQRTRDDSLNRMNERLLDHMIEIRNHHLIEEMRDFGRLEGEGKAQGLDNSDDMVMSSLICICASIQGGKRAELTERMSMGAGQASGTASSVMPKVPVKYAIWDHYGRQVQEVNSETEGWAVVDRLAKHYNLDLRAVWKVIPIVVMKANTCHSPIFDSNGAERELYESGVSAKNITPDLVYLQREVMNHRRHANVLTGEDD